MTPGMLVAALKRKREIDERAMRNEDLRIGTLAAAVYTAGGVTEKGRSKRKPWTAGDFFQSCVPEEVERPSQPVLEQLTTIEAWNAALGGRDLRRSKTS